uniref:Putative 2-oxoglutarate dehydrogenase E1 component DHKTD1, mitochondrial n=2 Tax=Parasteatoda tepidariorum TaxID=114398 RepID=A0A2L2Y0C6_PARTP
MNRLLKFKFFQIKQFSCKYHSSLGVYGFKPKSNDNVNSENLPNKNYGSSIYQILEAYRNHGHRIAFLNPLRNPEKKYLPVLDPVNYGFSNNSSEKISLSKIFSSLPYELPISELLPLIEKIYCNKIGIEVQHLEEHEKDWLVKEFEKIQLETQFSNFERQNLAQELIKSQVFENFLATKFSTVKRYGGEGAESMIAFFIEILNQCCIDGVKDVQIGIAHRGRLALLTGLLKFPPVAMFQKMSGLSEFPPDVKTTGDVLSHLTSSVDYEHNNSNVHVTLLPNPSHLEAISPVVAGYARSRLQTMKAADYSEQSDSNIKYPVLPIQVHGDASFSGQGVVMETLAVSNVPHFTTGGSIHLIVNNQVGFTTPQERGSSSIYSSDLMKMISSPIIHVNGDSPEDVVKATKLAFKYRQEFKKDVLVDMFCFRRWGHNEVDDPTFTNPLMYKIIHSRKSVPDIYAESLITENVLSKEDVNKITKSYWDLLNENLKQTESYKTKNYGISNNLNSNEDSKKVISVYDTGINVDLLKFVGARSVELPKNFAVHPRLEKNFIQERIKKISTGSQLDWATAEALAIGSLLYQGHNVRISGQDVGRGTFSHRHAMLIDQTSGEMHIPLNNMFHNQPAYLEVANSVLSEEGVLSFEYGFSVENTNNLVIWEAQFGDFFNSAQVVFDTLISSGETKWLLPSRLVILLPHGYDGAGPEHSSCRMERFLQMCDSSEDKIDSDDVNWHIANPTTPAQYFHLLRHQMLCELKKPLIVVAPKILIRDPNAISSLEDMAPGKSFKSVLGDNSVSAENVKTVIFCSGKHFYLLQKERENRKLNDHAIIRIEKLSPFPVEEIHKEMQSFQNAKRFIWSQEEHQNMGAWTFIQPRFRNLLGCNLKYAGRRPLGTPAVGIGKLHQEEIKSVLSQTFE